MQYEVDVECDNGDTVCTLLDSTSIVDAINSARELLTQSWHRGIVRIWRVDVFPETILFEKKWRESNG